MLGSAFDTTVDDSIATNRASSRPDSASSTSRCVMAVSGVARGVVVSAVCVMSSDLHRVRRPQYPMLAFCNHLFRGEKA